MAMLRDLEGRPVKFRQGGDKTGNDAGFADAAGVPADDYERHFGRWSFVPWSLAYSFGFDCFASRDKTANCFRYSLIGRAGVPQKTTPLPRRTFLGRMPLWPPRIVPS